MYLQLYQIKKHLNIDDEFHDDDEYLGSLALAAEKAVELSIDDKLSKLEDDEGYIPTPLSQAMLQMVGSWYANRESVAPVSMQKVPHTFDFVIYLYRNYYNKEDNESRQA